MTLKFGQARARGRHLKKRGQTGSLSWRAVEVERNCEPARYSILRWEEKNLRRGKKSGGEPLHKAPDEWHRKGGGKTGKSMMCKVTRNSESTLLRARANGSRGEDYLKGERKES